jgi:hypothetical protein
MARTVSSPEAIAAIRAMQGIITGDFTNVISALNKQAAILLDKSFFDGVEPTRFQQEIWPKTDKELKEAQNQLNQMSEQLSKMLTNIAEAGGGA